MTQLGNDTAPMSGNGTDADRLSISPQSIRRGGAEYTDIGAGSVQTNAGQLNYDKNTVESLGPVEWDAPGSRPTAP
jgi:hypothetical protein